MSSLVYFLGYVLEQYIHDVIATSKMRLVVVVVTIAIILLLSLDNLCEV